MEFKIKDRKIGAGHPVYVIAEISGNHNQDLNEALALIKAAKLAGADAVKLQTYTPDTITLDCDSEIFRIKGTIWSGKRLYDLYGEACTPWEWQPRLKQVADDLGMDLFSSPFDSTSVDFLQAMDVPAYKVASFELVDIPLIRKVAATGKPVLMSTGMATLGEIEEAVKAARDAGAKSLALLKCTSAYPASAEEMHLRTIPHMAEAFGVPVGLSDHTLGSGVAVAAVALGACIVEKHFTLSRAVPGPDSSFSMEPAEFKEMMDVIRMTEKALGKVRYGSSPKEAESRIFRRSLFAVRDIRAGEILTAENVRSIRPGNGMHTRHFDEVMNRRARRDIAKGTPMDWDLIENVD